MFLMLAVLEIVFPSNREWAVAWADSCAPLTVLGVYILNVCSDHEIMLTSLA